VARTHGHSSTFSRLARRTASFASSTTTMAATSCSPRGASRSHATCVTPNNPGTSRSIEPDRLRAVSLGTACSGGTESLPDGTFRVLVVLRIVDQ
jgi:hypothetical protein